MFRNATEAEDVEMMKARLEEPLPGENPDSVSPDVIEDEMAAFRRAKAAL